MNKTPKSMTGYGRYKGLRGTYDVSVEVKSVNHRYMDVNVRLPRVYAVFEDRIKQIAAKYVFRGKIDVSIYIGNMEEQTATVSLNAAYLDGYLAALYELRDKYGLRDDLSVMGVSANRDIFRHEQPDEDEEILWREVFRPAAEEAFAAFDSMRVAEGIKLRDDMLAKLEVCRSLTNEIEASAAVKSANYFESFKARLSAILGSANISLDENRIVAEAAIYADKAATDEEIVRLNGHFEQFSDILNGGVPAGRKLDFLLQEMNREVNTIGSKADDFGITRNVVELKSELEKIREQVQNVE